MEPPGHHALEPTADAMREMASAAAEFAVRFIEALPDAPASDVEGFEALVDRLREPSPEAGSDLAPLLDLLGQGAAKGFTTAGPGYLAYVPGGGLFAAAVADFLANAINKFVGVWQTAPALVQMEATAIRWLCDQFDYPPEARGILTSGGSMANFTAIVSARRALLPEDFVKGTLYVSDQAHLSVPKAAVLAGFPQRNVRWVATTPELRMDLDALGRMIRDDRAMGLLPFCVVVSAGTTNTGAVDPIGDAVALAHGEGMWVHVDGAYGGFFQITERGRRLFEGISEADSITLDPHKAMFLPYGTGSLLVRDGSKLRAAHMVGGDYLQDLAPEDEIPNFTDYSPELSRDFRGLRVWLPIKLHGLRAFRDALDEKLDLARLLDERLRTLPGLDLPWQPELTVVPFRLATANGNVDPDELNREFLHRINASKRVFLSSTSIGGRFILRACIVSHRTHRDRVEEAAGIVARAARELTD